MKVIQIWLPSCSGAGISAKLPNELGPPTLETAADRSVVCVVCRNTKSSGWREDRGTMLAAAARLYV